MYWYFGGTRGDPNNTYVSSPSNYSANYFNWRMLYSLLVATSIGYALAFSPARNSRFLSVKGTQLGAKAEPKPDNETQEQLRARMQRKARKMVLV